MNKKHDKPLRLLPGTPADMIARNWAQPDIILVTSDPHVDHPAFPAPLIGRVLEADGWKVCILSRPDPARVDSILAFGQPRLFWGVTAGALDSMVANYTANRKRRSDDPYAPGGRAGGRPDRAVTVYGNMIRKACGKAAFIVTGGIEASLRRFAHYDFWSDSVRRPILMDCAASILVHGMGEGPVREIARRLEAFAKRESQATSANVAARVECLMKVPGVVYRVPASQPPPADARELPSAEAVAASPEEQARAFQLMEANRGRILYQQAGGMRVVANPAWTPESVTELDRIYELPFTREAHPMYGGAHISALETVRHSITSHRGCFGGCAFCAIGVHQGKRIHSRSTESILREIRRMVGQTHFRGTVTDVGGPTANMFGAFCSAPEMCSRPSCLWPDKCRHLKADQRRYLELLQAAERVEGVKHLFVGTGIRMDLALDCEALVEALALRHTSGTLKVAPEHVSPAVLKLMRKPDGDHMTRFLELHRRLSRRAGRQQFVVPYLMAAHPGSTMKEMNELAAFLQANNLLAEQCQIFTPTPGTASTVMYATGLNPANMQRIFVERTPHGKDEQKQRILHHLPVHKPTRRH